MKKFCFICGEKTQDLKEGRCKQCYNKNITLIKVPEEIVVTTCSKCGLFKVKHKWKKTTIRYVILDKIKIIEKNVKIEVNKKGVNYEIIATNGKEEVHKIRLKILKRVCQVCARKFTQYYNAVLQIRGDYDDDVIDFIDDQLFIISKKDKMAFYTFDKIKVGINIRIGSKSAATKIAEKLKKKYKCTVKRSYKLIGKIKGKQIYRDFISLRFN